MRKITTFHTHGVCNIFVSNFLFTTYDFSVCNITLHVFDKLKDIFHSFFLKPSDSIFSGKRKNWKENKRTTTRGAHIGKININNSNNVLKGSTPINILEI